MERLRNERAILGDVCRRISQTVGDGCLAWGLEAGDGAMVLQSHADRHLARGPVLVKTRQRILEPRAARWLRQALISASALRVPLEGAARAQAIGLPRDAAVADAVLVPVGLEFVLAVYRSLYSPAFTAADRVELERISAGAAEALGEISGSSPGHLPDIADVATAAIVVTDPRGVITSINQAACELMGTTADEILGTKLGDAVSIPPDSSLADFSGPPAVDVELYPAGGESTWVQIATRPLFGVAGEPIGAVHTIWDLDRRRRREGRLRLDLDVTRTLYDLSVHALGGEPLEQLQWRAAGAVAAQFGAPLVLIGEMDEDLMEATPRACAGRLAALDPDRWLEPFALVPRSPGWAALDTGSGVRVSSLPDDARYAASSMPSAIGTTSTAVAPAGEGSVAAVFYAEEEAVSDDELMMLEQVGRILGARS